MNGNSVALDTNLVIAVLNGEATAVGWVGGFKNVFLPVPVLAELRFGALNSARVTDNIGKIEQLAMRCAVLDVTANTAVAYANVRLALKRAATPIPENDVWIAAVCIEHNLPLATYDAHFAAVSDLQVVKP